MLCTHHHNHIQSLYLCHNLTAVRLESCEQWSNMKMNFILGQFFWVLLSSSVAQSSANILSGPLRVSTRHFAPYMYQDSKGNFHKGLEFELLQKMAEMLNVRLHFQATSNHSDICYDLAMNATDICIGGIFPTEDTLKYAAMSVTYAGDDLTWCVRKAKMMPKVLAQMHLMQAVPWLLVIFGYGYTSGLLIYFLVQFDLNFKRRNMCDWHQATWLVALPAILGQSPNFQPLKGTVRIFFVFLLITEFFLFQIIFTRMYDSFVYAQKPWHQISSFHEIMDRDLPLVGSREAFNLVNQNKMIPSHKIESFNVCDDISECLADEPNLKNLAIGGTRQNIINSPAYSSSQLFCFDGLENIASYPIAMYMRKDLALEAKINAIIQQLLESGFFVKWTNDFRIDEKDESPDMSPVALTITHILGALVFMVGCGWVVSTAAFAAENLIYWKMRGRRGSRHTIWAYLEQFVDGRRNYFKNVPERLQMQNRNFEERFPYLE